MPRSDAKRKLDLSENHRINPQRRKEDNPLPPRSKLECLPWGVIAEDHFHVVAELRQVEMGQNDGLQIDNQVFVGRKNIIVGELDLAVEVFAAALGIELDDIVQFSGFHLMVLMMVPHAMHTCHRGITEATRQLVVFSTIVEFHIPPDRDEQHREDQQKGADLQQPFFHAAKIQIFTLCAYLAEVFVIHQTGVFRESPMLIVAVWVA